ncbi:MFS polyamine transporter [Suillus ampliporus]|nr:MFS polyamine transporter [Suillus ampliporus]
MAALGLGNIRVASRQLRPCLIVDWDGPNDPQNPKSAWSFRRKWAATAIVSSFTFISPVSSSMIAPATGQVAATFGIHNEVIMALTTSIFVLAYAFGPLVLGPLSEIYGRSRVLQLSNLWYLVWNLGCGFAQTESQLLAFRFLAGLGGSAPMSIGGAVVGDCWRPEERGKAVAIFSLAPLLGPVIGPITGAWITELSTWRWVFRATSIVDAAIQIIGLFFLQETYAPLLLERKAERIRRSMDAEKVPYKKSVPWRAIMIKSLIRPFALFVREPIVQLLGIYMGYLYGILYRRSFIFRWTCLLTTMPSIFQGVYHQPVGIAGLHYIALGIGLTGASQLNANTMDKAHTHWIAPDIGIMLVGAGIILNFQCIQTYIIDSFTLHAASALATTTFLRSLAGFVFPLFAPAMYNALGFGKGDTIIVIVAIVIGCPAPWIFWHYGERIRNSSRYARN